MYIYIYIVYIVYIVYIIVYIYHLGESCMSSLLSEIEFNILDVVVVRR